MTGVARSRATVRIPLFFALSLFAGCPRAEAEPTPPAAVPAAPKPAASVSIVPTPAASALAHPWLADAAADLPKSVDTLEQRFATPAGFTRVPVAPKSFGAFLRVLPLAAAGTPVLTHQGKVLHEATHPNIAAVVAIDIGKADLQQCADSVIRMHAEWQWWLGKRDQHYSTAGGPQMSFAKYLLGERHYWKDGKLATKNVGATAATHPAFRTWLDQVFGSANTGSLSKEAKVITVGELQPGDFVVMTGVPFGHAVMVLDLAKNADGKRIALLGQGYMPAQSFQVLRKSPKETWFVIDEASGKLETPFWDPFPWSTLRRLPD